MTLEQAQKKYGKIENYLNNLRDLLKVDDMQTSDVDITLRDINFIRSQAGLKEWDETDIIERL